MKKFTLIVLMLSTAGLSAQEDSLYYYGDTSVFYNNMVVHLLPVAVIGVRFASIQDRIEYQRMQYAINKVYPYYVHALELMEETDARLSSIEKKRKQKKYLKKKHSMLKEEYQNELMQLTVTQGYVLVKMIERGTGMTLYDIIRKYKGGLAASYWNTIARLNGYSLKEPYEPGQVRFLEPIMQALEQD